MREGAMGGATTRETHSDALTAAEEGGKVQQADQHQEQDAERLARRVAEPAGPAPARQCGGKAQAEQVRLSERQGKSCWERVGRSQHNVAAGDAGQRRARCQSSGEAAARLRTGPHKMRRLQARPAKVREAEVPRCLLVGVGTHPSDGIHESSPGARE